MDSKLIGDKCIVPIVFSTNKLYVPFLFTAVLSIVNHGREGYFYKIFVLHKEVDEETQIVFREYFNGDISEIVFIDVNKHVEGYGFKVVAHFTDEVFFRFLIPEILEEYSKIVYLDCDLIICHDVADLFNEDLEGHALAAGYALGIMAEFYRKESDTRKYLQDTLGINDPRNYFQTGVLVIDNKKFRSKISKENLLEMATQRNYRLVDQDILSMVFQGDYKRLNVKWNLPFDHEFERRAVLAEYLPVEIYNEYEEARKNPNIVHYAGSVKPWDKPGRDMGYLYWAVARNSPYYESLIAKMVYNENIDRIVERLKADIENNIFIKVKEELEYKIDEKVSEILKEKIRKYTENTYAVESNIQDNVDKTEDVEWLKSRVKALENSYSYRFGNFFMRVPYKILTWFNDKFMPR